MEADDQSLAADASCSPKPPDGRPLDALKSIEVAAQFVASDASQLLGGLQASLQALSHASANHMELYRDSAAHVAERAAEAVAAHRGFISKCQELDGRMLAVARLHDQLHDIDHALTQLEERFPAAAPAATASLHD